MRRPLLFLRGSARQSQRLVHYVQSRDSHFWIKLTSFLRKYEGKDEYAKFDSVARSRENETESTLKKRIEVSSKNPGPAFLVEHYVDRPEWSKITYQKKTAYFYDITGKNPLAFLNSYLSRDVKKLITLEYKKGVSVSALAKKYDIRKERVLAIVALDKIRKEMPESEKEGRRQFADIMEGVTGENLDGSDSLIGLHNSSRLKGVGEKHVVNLPKAPHYEERMMKEDGYVDWERRELRIAKREEEMMFEEFKDRLAFNTGEVAPSLSRKGHKHLPSRPKGGYALLVKPLGKTATNPYVMTNKGVRRELNDDENFLQHMRRIRRRKKLR